MDLIYHSGVLCQTEESDYDQFFGKIRDLKPKYYMFSEGITACL